MTGCALPPVKAHWTTALRPRGLWHLLVCMIGGTHKGPRSNVTEAHLFSKRREACENVWMHESLHRKVVSRGLQVLA
ncbi:hypothetical protein D3C86_2021790 [compost metagenome]